MRAYRAIAVMDGDAKSLVICPTSDGRPAAPVLAPIRAQIVGLRLGILHDVGHSVIDWEVVGYINQSLGPYTDASRLIVHT